MRVKVEEIQSSGLDRSEDLSRELLSQALTDADGFRLAKASPLEVRLSKIGERVLVKGGFTAELFAECKRCGNDTPLSLPVKFDLRMVPKVAVGVDKEGDDDEGGERAGTFEMEEADAEPFDGKTIELDPIVREQILLALPVSVLCKEDCKGLCTVCGQDLNEKECGCERKVVDVRLAKLKDIKLN